MSRRKPAEDVPLLLPSTIFRLARGNVGMVRMIVGRCNVGESMDEVAAYVVSRLKPDCLPWQREMVDRLARILHRLNRKEYARVMGGPSAWCRLSPLPTPTR